MKPYTERRLFRWTHIILSIPIIGYIYGPVAQIPQAVFTIRWVLMPIIVLSGFWMWLGPRLKRKFRKIHRKSKMT